MKKIMIALALAALAFSVQAELVDGSMDLGIHTWNQLPFNTSVDTLNTDQDITDAGWVTGGTQSAPSFTIGSGYASLTSTVSTQVGLTQFFTSTLTGVGTLKYDVNYNMSFTADQTYAVVLVGFNDADNSFSVNLTSSASNLSTTNADEASGYLGTTGTIQIGLQNSGGWVTNNQIAVDFGVGGWDYYVLNIWTRNMTADGSGYGGGSDVFQIDNVQIVPEPATAGLLGIGTLMAWFYRRSLRKAKEQFDE